MVVFGSLFSDIRLQKTENGDLIKDIRIPIAYSGKEKYIRRFESDKTQNQLNLIEVDLPRLSFEMLGLNYASDRKINKNGMFISKEDTTQYQITPVPYDIPLNLYAYTKNMEDMLKIVEQITPNFTPNYTVTMNTITELGVKQDVPFILNSITPQMQLSEDFTEYRYIIYTFSFTAKINLYASKQQTSEIKIVDVDLNQFGSYKVTVNPLSAGRNDEYTIIEEIKELNEND
jgi:hypothetical protein